MDRVQHSFDNYGLHQAAITGDDEGIRRALNAGADINALDNAGRTVIMCVIAGEHWQDIDASDASFMTQKRLNAIRTILAHPDISLFTLNAPHSSMNGVIPLGMAAWLNMPTVVRLLLEDSANAVSVDGMDSHGATALMYAARDASLDVVQLLLLHGARPDFRDCNHRTSIQFALAHPQILWLCETVLRRHRWRESEAADRTKLFAESTLLVDLAHSALQPSDNLAPPPITIFADEANARLTETLISSIRSSELSFIHSLLFSPALPPTSSSSLYPMSAPVLVNRPDEKGWSPIHYCVAVEEPSVEVLDALYCAGADVALFTVHEQCTPLHILAHSARISNGQPDCVASLYDFTVHLIRDLRAPLSARDKEDETCIHVAAEHGGCIELLMILLDCDTTGCIRELRNARGLTALEVAKPEFRLAFGADAEKLRSISVLSNHTIRVTESFTSLASFSDWNPVSVLLQDDSASLYSPSDLDVGATAQQLLLNLRTTSPSAHHQNDPAHVDRVENIIAETTELSKLILKHYRARVAEVVKEIEELRKNSEKICDFRNAVSKAAAGKLAIRGLHPILPKKRNRDSEDSQITAISKVSADESIFVTFDSSPCLSTVENGQVSVAIQTAAIDFHNATLSRSNMSWSAWFDSLIHSAEASTYKTYLANLWEVEHELADYHAHMEIADQGSLTDTVDPKLKHLLKKKRKIEEKIRELEQDHKSEKKHHSSTGTGKLKAWFKRMVVSEPRPSKLDVVMEVDEQGCNVAREVKVPAFQLMLTTERNHCEEFDTTIDGALQTSQVVLDTVERDLLRIGQCLASADQFIELANHSIARAERVMKRAVKKREAMVSELRLSSPAEEDTLFTARDPGSPGFLGYSDHLNLRPSLASIASVYSAHSSTHSLATTLMEHEDEDTRIIRRLLLRKIEAQTSGAWDEVDKTMGWLRVVKEVVRGVKRRAYV
ncbi:hypothetical protein BDQ12DRAFT_687935 [Crucibulum laeve]|uniref:Ankyrin repeat-containing domain protein n=1 Tax=Crucibulum laeve TaxID=68775 RepID=A0A5C3LR39_9AGAR|nr:hypothetical protein BDQ12DRAFT_687935 [Crucibulum laeve]